jgi:hypothetical protein
MRKDLLIALDVCAVLAAISLLLFTWFYQAREMFLWGVLLAQLVFLLIFLLNAGKLVSDYIDSGKNGKLTR